MIRFIRRFAEANGFMFIVLVILNSIFPQETVSIGRFWFSYIAGALIELYFAVKDDMEE